MNKEVLRYLRCPHCCLPLVEANGSLRCPHRHTFDVARQGYVDLATGPVAHPGDTAAMVAARADFLSTGHYDFISAALAAAAKNCPAAGRAAGLVVDAGAGTGHHLAAVLDALPRAAGLALDSSKPAVRRAARAHPRAIAARCDTWQRLPLATGSAAVLLNVFAPRNNAEFHRVLRADGSLLVVTPTPQHLVELVAPLGLLSIEPGKRARILATLAPWFTRQSGQRLHRTLHLTHPQIRALVAMGPSAWHTDPQALAGRIAALPTPTASVTVSVHLDHFSCNDSATTAD